MFFNLYFGISHYLIVKYSWNGKLPNIKELVSCVAKRLIITVISFLGYSPFRGNASKGAIRRILKMAFDRLGYIGLGDYPAGLGNWPRRC